MFHFESIVKEEIQLRFDTLSCDSTSLHVYDLTEMSTVPPLRSQQFLPERLVAIGVTLVQCPV